jgi:hypothetical protein
VVDGLDDSRLLQEKIGNYGEGIFTKEHRNPLKKTTSFIYDLKRYLCQLDARCKQLYIIVGVGFSELADISAIYDSEAGMIHTAQLPAFFERHGRSVSAASPPWLHHVLYRVPTWDLIITTKNEWINGVIVDEALTFQRANRQRNSLPYRTLYSVTLQRAGW